MTASSQVSWWSVHEYVDARLADVASWPTAGTPEWCELDDRDPVKLAALLDAAQHWSLRLETCQQARAEASRDISTAADWPGIAQAVRRHADAVTSGAYIPREEVA